MAIDHDHPADRPPGRGIARRLLGPTMPPASAPSPVPLPAPSVPDLAATLRDFSGASVVAATVRGRSHVESGVVRQDAVAFGLSPSGRYLIATVCDGVSSARASDEGAAAAATEGLAIVGEVVDEAGVDLTGDLRILVERLASKVRRATAGWSARDVATTWTTVVLDLGARSDEAADALLLQVGDSPAFLVNLDIDDPVEAWQRLGPAPRPGALRDWIPGAPTLTEARTFRAPPGSLLLVTSDGFGEPADVGDGPFQPIVLRRLLGPMDGLDALALAAAPLPEGDDQTFVAVRRTAAVS